jgi:hypothetical protein
MEHGIWKKYGDEEKGGECEVQGIGDGCLGTLAQVEVLRTAMRKAGESSFSGRGTEAKEKGSKGKGEGDARAAVAHKGRDQGFWEFVEPATQLCEDPFRQQQHMYIVRCKTQKQAHKIFK